jgi:hypothetical protein
LSAILHPFTIGAALALLFVIRSAIAMHADGRTVDEPVHLAYAERGLAQGTWTRDDESLNSKMPATALNALPAFALSHWTVLDQKRRLVLARSVTVMLSLVLAYLVWRWATELFGRQAGPLALLLYTFCPNVLAHSHLVTTDIPTALAMFAATYFSWRHVVAPSPMRLFVAGVTVGLAQLTKNSALLLFPIFAAIMAIRIAKEAFEAHAQNLGGPSLLRWLRRRGVEILGQFAVLCIASIVVLNLGFSFEGTLSPLKSYTMVSPLLKTLSAMPLVREIPIPLPAPYLDGLDMVASDATGSSWSYLRGAYSDHGFRSYFFWAFLVKVPIATQLLVLAAAGLLVARSIRAIDNQVFLFVPVLILFGYLSLFFSLDIGLRYFLPAFPFLFVFASQCAGPFVGMTAPVHRGWRLALIALLAWLAVASWKVHPDYLTYFNEIAGGPSKGWHWLIDSNLDWSQRSDYLQQVYVRHSPVRVWIDPSGPLPGRVAVGLSGLVGADPTDAARHRWLRENFTPTETIGHSINVYDVTPEALARCCSAMTESWPLEDTDHDLALAGDPIGGGEDVTLRSIQRLNDGMLGSNDPSDASRSVPVLQHPVRAWFGIHWSQAQTVSRIVVFPGFYSRGPDARRWLAIDYTLQYWDGGRWLDIPGAQVEGNRALHRTHAFAPVRTNQVRVVIDRERNERGLVSSNGGFRAACLELAAYEK